MGQSYNGISETVCAGWFPMTLWALIRMMERPNFQASVCSRSFGCNVCTHQLVLWIIQYLRVFDDFGLVVLEAFMALQHEKRF